MLYSGANGMRLVHVRRNLSWKPCAWQVCLAQLLNTCARLHPKEFSSLTPTTWWVGKEESGKAKWPAQLKRHAQHCHELNGHAQAFILKPDDGCQGAGIALVRRTSRPAFDVP